MNRGEGKSIRRQASLYLYGFPEIEKLRHQFNPVQAALIPAHVTLCREDEVDDWSLLKIRIQAAGPLNITIEFGRPVRESNLVYLPVVGGADQIENLRRELLGTATHLPRKQLPHLTIIHPRNGVCTDTVFRDLLDRCVPFSAIFREISLIEQWDGGPWCRFACGGQ